MTARSTIWEANEIGPEDGTKATLQVASGDVLIVGGQRDEPGAPDYKRMAVMLSPNSARSMRDFLNQHYPVEKPERERHWSDMLDKLGEQEQSAHALLVAVAEGVANLLAEETILMRRDRAQGVRNLLNAYLNTRK